MNRYVAAGLGGLLAVLALPGGASAAKFCTLAPSDEELAEMMSVDDPMIGGMSGISMAEPFRLLPPADDDEDTTLWCASPDDPRCRGSHLPTDRAPTFGSLDLRFAGPEVDDVAPPGGIDVMYRSCASKPSFGVRSRVERPPRA